jgi:hypothetical protein
MSFISLYANQLFLSSIFTKDTANFPLPTSFKVALLTTVPDRDTPSTSLVEPATSVAGTTNINKANTFAGNLAGLAGGTYVNYFMSSPMSYAFSDGQQVTITNTNATFNLTGIVKNTVLTNNNEILPWVALAAGVTITSITASTPAVGSFQVVTTAAHNLTDTSYVTISGASAYADTWEVDTIVNSTTFTVASSTTGAYTASSATATKKYGYGDVVTHDTGTGKLYYKNITDTNTATAPVSDQTNWLFLPFVDYNQFTIYIAPTVSSSFSGSGGIAVGNTGYARQTITTGSGQWTSGQSSVYNANALTWNAAYLEWGKIVGWALLDDQATPNVIASGNLQENIAVVTNTVVALPIGSLRLFVN